MDHADNIDELLQQATRGDQSAISRLLSMYRDRLTKMVQLRLDRRLFGRIGASGIATCERLSSWQRKTVRLGLYEVETADTCTVRLIAAVYAQKG